MNKTNSIIEKISTLILLSDPNDKRDLENLNDKLIELKKTFIKKKLVEGEIITKKCIGLLKNFQEGSADFGSVISGIKDSVDSLQKILPETFEKPGRKVAKNYEKISLSDTEVLNDFINKQESVLEKLDVLLFNLEQNQNTNDLSELKRLIHTLKGESGFLDFNEIVEVSHALETLLEETQEVFKPEIFFQFKDWLSEAIRKIKEGDKITSNEKILALIKKNKKGETGFLRSESSEVKNDSIRISTDKLDKLINIIGELVIVESMISQESEKLKEYSLQKNIQHMKKITKELQESSMSLRLVTLKNTFIKMSRIAGEVAGKKSKQVQFFFSGEETELDKTVVDKINDPLVHMVRNAVDHGIEETQDERRSAGKNPVGKIQLRAFHKSGSVYIEIEDDGKGLDRETILDKAKKKNIIKNEGSVLTDKEIFDIIFIPGFTTAKEVTEVSGRGLGLDVVKKSIESFHGQVEYYTSKGKGTTFSIKLPLTLAIIDGMITRIGNEKYILPVLSILASLRPEKNQIKSIFEKEGIIRFQDKPIPLLNLKNFFRKNTETEFTDSELIVIVEDSGRRAGIVIDELLGQQEIVIKNLGDLFTGIPCVSGGAIMSDGTVGLILDIEGILKLANKT